MNRVPTYLYCLLTARGEPPRAVPRGLDDAPVRTVRAGAVDAWVSDVTQASPTPTIERVRAHDGVVRYALDVETPLPARFGQTFGSDAALVESVGARGDALRCALERVQGLVEMTVRVLPPTSVREAMGVVGTAGVSGREYLHRLRDRQRAERAWEEEAGLLHGRVAAAVRDVVRAEVRSALARPTHALVISHLVERDGVARYRAALHALQREPGSHLMVSGPWAPYSFAELTRA